MSQYFPSYEACKKSGYAKEDDLQYLKTENSIKKYLVFMVQKISCHGNLWECLMKYLNL